MRILVISDSHGRRSAIERAIREQPTAEVIIFLGDGADEAEDVKARLPKEKKMLSVRGNNDWCCSAPDFDVLSLENAKIFFTHGHLYDVKYDLYKVVCAAKSHNANILLFGHTHCPMVKYDDGLYLMNPGALSHAWNGRPGYGIIDLTPSGFMLNTVEFK